MTGEDQEKVMPETREVRVKSERVGFSNQVVWISCPREWVHLTRADKEMSFGAGDGRKPLAYKSFCQLVMLINSFYLFE